MHIEPGLVDTAKIGLSYATAAAVGATALFHVTRSLRHDGLALLAIRSAIATVAVLIFFEILPHFPVGVSEVHLILGTSILLLLGTAPAAIGLAGGLLLQGFVFAPTDLPQFGMNITTLLAPLFVLHEVNRRMIAPGKAYVDLGYGEVLRMSFIYQGGIVAWVAFWAFYGAGFGATNVQAIASFGLFYMAVLLIEPLVDLALLAGAKRLRNNAARPLVNPRAYA